jgi:cytochrome b involved in lipid metabolism
MKIKKIIGTIIVIIFATGVIVILSKQKNTDSNIISNNNTTNNEVKTENITNQTTKTTIPSKNSQSYTISEVANHNSQSSCWTAINGSVYNVTSWINKHPGGKNAILGLCGKDGSSAFDNQHGGQRRPEQELATFKIGTLSQ